MMKKDWSGRCCSGSTHPAALDADLPAPASLALRLSVSQGFAMTVDFCATVKGAANGSRRAIPVLRRTRLARGIDHD